MITGKPVGGAATAGGMNYQYRVTAWVAVQVLAEKEMSPPWELHSGTTLEWLRCETEQPVDDLMVGTSEGGLIFSQVKHTLQLSASASSDLASALEQCVRQYIVHTSGPAGPRLWEWPLDPGRDRLVLLTGPGSSTPIRAHLSAMLSRMRALIQGQSLNDAAVNRQEQHALSTVVGHVTRAWQAALGVLPTDDEIKQLLSLIRVHVLDVDTGGTGEQKAKLLLRTVVLRTPTQADTAWASLIAACAEFAAGRSGADRPGLQQLLLHAGIDLQAVRSYPNDIERLRAYSQTTADALANLARIRVGAAEVKIQRRSTEELRRTVEEDSLLVVGEPGAGKSGALHDLVAVLRDEGRDVVFLAVDRLAAHSLGELRQELGLARDPREILVNWPGTTPAFLIIDALDAARAGPAERTIRELIRAIMDQKGRWRIVASIRKFDLRYGQEFQQLFLGEPPTLFRDKEFPRLRHLNILHSQKKSLLRFLPGHLTRRSSLPTRRQSCVTCCG